MYLTCKHSVIVNGSQAAVTVYERRGALCGALRGALLMLCMPALMSAYIKLPLCLPLPHVPRS
jgi:hypothetical protein